MNLRREKFVMFNNEDFKKTVDKYLELCADSGQIDQRLYSKYDVKRGLRESNGKGVLTGLTEISDVNGFDEKNGTAGRVASMQDRCRAAPRRESD